MATVSYQGRGSHLQTSPDGVTYTSVAQLRKFAFSGLKSTVEDITNCDSPSAFMEVLPTIINPGDMSYDGILNPTDPTTVGLSTKLQQQTLTYFKLTLIDGSSYTFTGYVTEHVPVQVDYSKALTFAGKISITGPVVKAT